MSVAQQTLPPGPRTPGTVQLALVAKRLPATRGLPQPKRVARLSGMLARKGYPSSLAYHVVREALLADGEADFDA